MSTLITMEMNLEVTGEVSLGTPQHYSRTLGQYLPGDPPSVKNLKVTYNGLDITDSLTASDRKEIEDDMVEDALAEEAS